MATPLKFTSGGKPYERDAEKILFAKGKKKKCTLTFKDDEELVYPYGLKKIEKLLEGKNYRRVGKSYFVYYPAFVDTRYMTGILWNGKRITLFKEEYEKLKKHLLAKKNRLFNLPF